MEMALCVLGNCLARPKLPQWSPLRSLVSSLVSPWPARIPRSALSRTQHRRTDDVVDGGWKRSSPPPFTLKRSAPRHQTWTQTPPIRYRNVTPGFLHFRTLATIAGPAEVTSSGFQIEIKKGTHQCKTKGTQLCKT